VENGHADLEPAAYRRPGRHINYHVDLNPFGTDALFFAGVPEMVDLRYSFLLRTATASYRIGQQSSRGVHYDSYSGSRIRRRLRRRPTPRHFCRSKRAATICNCRRSTRESPSWRAP